METHHNDTQIITAWLASKQPGTARVYQSTALAFQAAMAKPLATVTLENDRQWLAQWAQQEPATQARKIRTLRSLYRFGQAEAGWPSNPFEAIPDPEVPDHLRQRMPTAAEVAALLTAADATGPRMSALVSFVFGTGARIKDLVAATWGHITPDPAGWTWRIATRQPATSVSLRPEIVRALRAWRVAQGLSADWTMTDSTPLFPNRHGLPSHPVTLTASIRKLALKAGLGHAIPAFGLRHAHAGFALERGASVQSVQRALGHRWRVSTLRYLNVVQQPDSSADFLPWPKIPKD